MTDASKRCSIGRQTKVSFEKIGNLPKFGMSVFNLFLCLLSNFSFFSGKILESCNT